MNHADRQRLSQVLLAAWTHNDDGRISDLLAEARAIVDAPTEIPNVIIKFNGPTLADTTRIKDAVRAAFADQAPSPKLDAFLSEPIHEYQPIEAYGLRINRSNHRAGRTRLTTVAALALASIALTAATATQSARPGPSHQPLPKPAANQPPRAGETQFPATHFPYLPGHTPGTPGTPGNGLGVVVATP